MIFIQLTGLPGAGKTSIALGVKSWMSVHHKELTIEVVDGDDYRKTVTRDLGFSKEDRLENIRRLGAIAASFVSEGNIVILSVINPYTLARNTLKEQYGAKTVWINCPITELIKRDPKGLYQKALLPNGHPDKIKNLTGINDPFEEPLDPDLIINTATEDLDTSVRRLVNFIMEMV